MKGTRKWKCAVKIQALFRGYAFRVKRKRALERLHKKPKAEQQEEEFDFMEDEDFDAEAFLDVKQENLEQGDIFTGANASLLDKYVQVLAFEQKARETANQQKQFNHQARKHVSPMGPAGNQPNIPKGQ